MNQLLEQALKLPPTERRKLADEIYDSIEPLHDELLLTPEQEQELAERLEDLERNPGGNFSWEDIESEALAR